MPHTIRNVFDKKLNFENLLSAHYRARKQKVRKSEVIKFEMNLENNLTNLLHHLQNNTYKVGQYRTFYVTEPKLRKIEALPYVDRVVHQWYVEEFIKPNIVPKFIKDTYACIPGRGTHKAVDTVQRYMRICKRNWGNYWILKCDIHKYFYSIDPDILFNIMKKYITDKKLLFLTKCLIFDSRSDSIGIPIGNYTSQFFANIYLNELDQYVKHNLKIKYYVRYMDDFIFLLKDKESCKNVKNLVNEFVTNNLKLELNQKSRYYPCNQGLNFCGYRIWPTHRLLRNRCKRKILKKVRKWNKVWETGNLNFSIVMPSLQSWMGHSSHANSYNFKRKVIKQAKFIYHEDEEYPYYFGD